MELLTTSNYKLKKGENHGYQSWVLHLAPATLGGRTVCPKATPGCTAACLNTAGRGKMHKVQAGRLRKTQLYWEDRTAFLAYLHADISSAIRRSRAAGLTPCFRLNGTADIAWERELLEGKNMFNHFPDVQFYDYTKIPGRKVSAYKNYHLTFSRAESNDKDVAKAIAMGMNVAVVFRDRPSTYMGLPVFNGDDTDLRFLDPRPCIVGLSAKGVAKRDTSGFVVQQSH